MKKLVVIGLLTGLFVGNSAGFAFEPTAVEESKKEVGYISVNAHATKEVEPKQAVVSFAVETENKDLQKATDSLNELSAKLTEAIKTKISENDSIKTTAYSVSPQYSYSNKKRTFLGYKATLKMIVTTQNVDKLSAVIGTALANGATNVNGLNFQSTNNDAICNALLAEAALNARKNAESVANSLSAQLDGVKYISTSCGIQSTVARTFAMNKAYAASDGAVEEASSTPTIEPGTIKIDANVNGSFYIK